MMGMASRNENRAALSRSMPSRRAAVIVIPDRETPGCSANAWAKPRNRPVRGPMRSKPRSLRHFLSTYHSATPKIASIVAMSHGWPRSFVMASSKSRPAMAPGIVPMTSAHARRWSVVVIERAAIDTTQAFT